MDKSDSIKGTMDDMMKMATSTNAAKVTIGWDTPDNGYLEITFFAKKPKRR